MRTTTPIRLVLVLGQSLLTGCATIVKGTTQKITVALDPAGADVSADGKVFGQTPVDIELARKRDHLVTISKLGFWPKSIAITKSTGGAVWGNVIAGGLIGWGIDASSGAQYNLSPESISITLEQLAEGEVAESSGAKNDFVTRLNELDDLKDRNSISDEEYSAMRTSLFKEYYPEMDAEVGVGVPGESSGADASAGPGSEAAAISEESVTAEPENLSEP
jgi:hypothetical protein